MKVMKTCIPVTGQYALIQIGDHDYQICPLVGIYVKEKENPYAGSGDEPFEMQYILATTPEPTMSSQIIGVRRIGSIEWCQRLYDSICANAREMAPKKRKKK